MKNKKKHHKIIIKNLFKFIKKNFNHENKKKERIRVET